MRITDIEDEAARTLKYILDEIDKQAWELAHALHPDNPWNKAEGYAEKIARRLVQDAAKAIRADREG